MKLPPYGKALAERLNYGNQPFLVVVCIGLNSWIRAKEWNASPNDISTVVVPHRPHCSLLHWPVARCQVVIDWGIGPSDQQVESLIRALLNAGASAVTTRPLFVDHKTPIKQYCPNSSRLVQVRECIRTYPGSTHCAA